MGVTLQRTFFEDSFRDDLIALLPRLKVFAFALCGSGAERDTLLRTACARMLEPVERYPLNAPFDRWAYAQVYQAWLGLLRAHDDPLAQTSTAPGVFAARLYRQDGGLDETSAFLEALPPQQRAALSLIRGEGFTYADAAKVFDMAEDALAGRVSRAQCAFADRLSGSARASAPAPVEMLHPEMMEGAA